MQYLAPLIVIWCVVYVTSMQTKVKSTSTLQFNVPPKLTIQMRSAISVAQMRGGREVTDERTKRGSKEKLMKEPNIGPTNKTGSFSPFQGNVISVNQGISSTPKIGDEEEITNTTTPKRGTKKKRKKGSNLQTKNKSSSPKAESPLRRFRLSNSKTTAQKTPSTEEVISITPGISSSSNKGGKRKVADVSSSKRGTKKKLKKKPKIKSKKKSSSPKATSPLQRFGISNFRATAQETLTTKKGILITRSGLTSSKMKGKKGITTGSSPNRGAKRKLKKGFKNKPKKKGNGPKKNESQKRRSKIRPQVPSIQRFDISNSETSAPKKDKTKKELIKAKSLKGLKLKIPEEYPEDLRRTVTQSEDYSKRTGLSNGALPNNFSPDKHGKIRTRRRNKKRPKTAKKTNANRHRKPCFKNYKNCLKGCKLINSLQSGNSTDINSLDDIIAGMTDAGASKGDVIVKLLGKYITKEIRSTIANAMKNNISLSGSLLGYARAHKVRVRYKICANRCYAMYRKSPRRKQKLAKRINQKLFALKKMNRSTVVQTTNEGEGGDLMQINASTARISAETTSSAKEKIGDEQDIMMESGYNGDYPDYLHPTESTPLEPEELPSGYGDEEEALNNTVLVRNETLITNNASKKSYYSDKPLVCWHCSSIVSFDCEKLESVYGEPPEVHGRLTTSCRSGYCGYYSWISDYGYGTEIHQRSCADNPETFCNDSNAFLEMINTTSFVKKCTVCNTTMCNDSFLRSINSVLVVLIFFLCLI